METLKNFFKKYCNLIITILVIIVVIVGIFFLSKLGEDKYFKEISYEDYNTSSKNNSDTFVYFGSKEDTETFEMVKQFANDNSLKFRYIYTDELTDEQKDEVLGDNENVLYYGDNSYEGVFTSANIQQFLIDEGVLPKTFVTISMDDYVELMKEDYFVVVIGRTGCGFCSKYQPVMNEIIKSYDIDMYYVDIAYFDEGDYNTLINSSKYLKENEWGTPTTLVFKKGKFVEAFSGYAEKSTIVDFLKSTGVIK